MTSPDFSRHKYVQLYTFRKNGERTGTPMWFAVDAAGIMYMQTNAASLKVKRLRNRADVEVTASDRRGRPLGEPVFPGQASVHPADSTVADKTLRLLAAHYGWVFRIFNFFLKVFRRQLVYLEIQLG